MPPNLTRVYRPPAITWIGMRQSHTYGAKISTEPNNRQLYKYLYKYQILTCGTEHAPRAFNDDNGI